ncbi:methyltransferase-like protein 27 [Liolophura sinensis]|uniref:methyltransferase-like protein 27 n=1 Tax=Liolophura sinensis TaxID=3198878 RepID=UPI0031581154
MTEQVNHQSMDKFESFYRDYTTPDEVVKGYAEWVQNGYDSDFEAITHRGHVLVGDLISELFPSNREDVYILDIAAGTGRVGQALTDRGFRRIDALDPCLPMLEEAKKKNVYQRYINDRVSGDPLDIPEGTYDAVTCSAAFVHGHLPAEAIIELLRLIKTGGFIAMVGNAEYWEAIPEYREKMAGVIQKLESEKKLKVIKKEIKEGFIGQKYQAIELVLQKL